MFTQITILIRYLPLFLRVLRIYPLFRKLLFIRFNISQSPFLSYTYLPAIVLFEQTPCHLFILQAAHFHAHRLAGRLIVAISVGHDNFEQFMFAEEVLDKFDEGTGR